MTLSQKLIVSGLFSLVITLCVYLLAHQQSAFGSTVVGNEYNATTTGSIQTPRERVLQTGPGALGSVVLTGALTGGTITLYNATTSNVSLRTGQKATSTITIADIPSTHAVGTYTYDVAFTDGLLLVTSASPTAPTSTITYR